MACYLNYVIPICWIVSIYTLALVESIRFQPALKDHPAM